MQYEIELLRIPEQIVACLGGRGPLGELRDRAALLNATLERAAIVPEGPLMARFFDAGEYDPAATDYEVCRALTCDREDRVPDSIGGLSTAVIPAHHAMVARHRGPRGTLGDAHAALARELDSVGYRLAGPITEVFLEGPDEGRRPADFLTEVRYPFAR
jgi:effector-binding domain-containing protein